MFLKIEKGEKKMADKAANYTEEMVEKIVEEYTANPNRETVDKLASKYNKASRSIIAKLVREGVYKAAARVTKAGAPIVRKEEIVANIENAIGFALPTLVKASKADLDALNKYFLGN
jgi:hypothetical protein